MAEIRNIILQETEGMAENALKEVLDFVLFLKHKAKAKEPEAIEKHITELNRSELSHLEEEFATYRKDFPIED